MDSIRHSGAVAHTQELHRESNNSSIRSSDPWHHDAEFDKWLVFAVATGRPAETSIFGGHCACCNGMGSSEKREIHIHSRNDFTIFISRWTGRSRHYHITDICTSTNSCRTSVWFAHATFVRHLVDTWAEITKTYTKINVAFRRIVCISLEK